MQTPDWKTKYESKICSAAKAMRLIRSGSNVFVGTGCGQPQHLVHALVEHCTEITDVHIVHLLTSGSAPYADEQFASGSR